MAGESGAVSPTHSFEVQTKYILYLNWFYSEPNYNAFKLLKWNVFCVYHNHGTCDLLFIY